MQTVADLTVDQLLLFLMAFIRIASMIAVFPIIGSRGTPTTVKAGLSIILTMIIFPLLGPRVVDIPTSVLAFAVIAIKEVLVGLILGFAAGIFFATIQYGSRIIDQEMAFTFSETIDPLTDSQVTPIAQLNMIIFTVLFMVLGGHRIFIQALAHSFEVIKIGNVNLNTGALSVHLIKMTAEIFDLGIRFAAPVMVTLIITTAALGVIARTVPQLNIFIVGIPLKIGMGFLLIVLCMPAMVRIFENMIQSLYIDLFTLVKLMG
jgi:flagellar biosynthesis protein FliR